MGSKRKEARPIRLVKSIPGGDSDSRSAWLLENIDRMKGGRAKVGDIARDQFMTLLDDCVRFHASVAGCDKLLRLFK